MFVIYKTLRLCNPIKWQIKWNSSKFVTFQNVTCGFTCRAVTNVEINEVIAYLTAILSSRRERGRERDEMVCILPTQMMSEDAYSLAERQSLLLIKRKKSFQKNSISCPNGFLPFQERRFPPLINAIIRGSEDGAENIPPAPAFRPVNCISPQCWGKYFHPKCFPSTYFLQFWPSYFLGLYDLSFCWKFTYALGVWGQADVHIFGRSEMAKGLHKPNWKSCPQLYVGCNTICQCGCCERK